VNPKLFEHFYIRQDVAAKKKHKESRTKKWNSNANRIGETEIKIYENKKKEKILFFFRSRSREYKKEKNYFFFEQKTYIQKKKQK